MHTAPRSFSAASTVLFAALGTGLLMAASLPGSWDGALPPPPEAPPAELAAVPEAERLLFEVPDRFRRGDTLAAVLRRNGVGGAEVARLSEAFEEVDDVRALRADQTLLLHRDRRGQLSRIELPLEDTRTVELTREGDGWLAREISVPTIERRDVVRGVVESSLWSSVVAAGHSPGLVAVMAQVLEYDMDFNRETRRGDSFAVVVDSLLDRSGKPRGYGEIHAVRYTNRGRDIHAFRFVLPSGEFGYYDAEGNSLRRNFLAAPLAYTRISGVFTSRRLHPVHRVYRPHYGVDYAAPHGTPVRATADGVVTDAGMRGPNGNMVTLRHSRGYETKYLHLARIPREIRPGRRVRQREVIGFVGSTGVSTGAHLDYRMYRYGRPLDPRSHNLPPGPPIPAEHRPAFETWRDALLQALAPPSEPAETTRVAGPDAGT